MHFNGSVSSIFFWVSILYRLFFDVYPRGDFLSSSYFPGPILTRCVCTRETRQTRDAFDREQTLRCKAEAALLSTEELRKQEVPYVHVIRIVLLVLD